ncbi:hypothetical protein NC99_37180 [Sunxiuqinia dokdonensis]|uniref:Uncharacterized protein n=1 Tax=Sunxiuqinia dokdonensis TaxID=1409788 RepID=A0A0L8V4S3_9BACT|nr:hypothetical protein NC99_37180 [Sunxiuqinia dokdonensis]
MFFQLVLSGCEPMVFAIVFVLSGKVHAHENIYNETNSSD